MGWCSATEIFDAICKVRVTDKDVISALIDVLEGMDWDCQMDSEYWHHPVVKELMMQKHPDWFEDLDDV